MSLNNECPSCNLITSEATSMLELSGSHAFFSSPQCCICTLCVQWKAEFPYYLWSPKEAIFYCFVYMYIRSRKT